MNEASGKKAKKKYTVKDGKRYLDRTGKKYGRLTALYVTRYNQRNQTHWMCRCSCGKQIEVFSGNLNSGHTKGCGCRHGSYKHGEGGGLNFVNRSPEYQTLCSILQRCNNPKSAAYQHYGAKGIKVCPQWNRLYKFHQFLVDVGRRPTPRHSIDRWPNRNGNYEPGNVRWATDPQQNRNTSRNIWVVFNGEEMCLKDASAKSGVPYRRLQQRMKRGRMTFEQAVSLPLQVKMRNRKYRNYPI